MWHVTQLWSATQSQHGGCILHHRPNIHLLINCSRYTLHWTWDSINIEILNMWYVQCNVHESQKFFSSENITPDAYQPRPQKTKQFQMSHFHLMIFYYEALVILKSTGHFQFIHLLGFRCLCTCCNLRLASAYVYSPGEAWSIVSVDMIVICCHELEHDQTWLIFSMTI